MPLLTIAKCDRCETTADAAGSYDSLAKSGWVNVRLSGWTDAKGNTTKPEPPNQWLVCPKCRGELAHFLEPLAKAKGRENDG